MSLGVLVHNPHPQNRLKRLTRKARIKPSFSKEQEGRIRTSLKAYLVVAKAQLRSKANPRDRVTMRKQLQEYLDYLRHLE